MKIFDWNNEKNDFLQKERGISFEKIVLYIQSGKLLAVLEHPNPQKYKNQKIAVVDIDGYAYAVPYVETDEVIFLKTALPSRKYTKEYLLKESDEDEKP